MERRWYRKTLALGPNQRSVPQLSEPFETNGIPRDRLKVSGIVRIKKAFIRPSHLTLGSQVQSHTGAVILYAFSIATTARFNSPRSKYCFSIKA